MPRTLPIQESFAAGELSPRLYARNSLKGYEAGVESMINWITTPHGPFFKRPGFKFIDGWAGSVVKVFPFSTALKDYYVIFTDSNTIYVLEHGTTDVTTITVTETNAPPWTDAQIPFIQFVVTPSGNTMYLVQGGQTPMKIVHSAGAFTISTVGWTAAPAAWGAGDYPNTVAIHQGRLWLGGSPDHPTNIWASKSGDYEDMTTGAAADDALDFVLDKVGTIRWMAGVKKLIVGTQFQEFTIYANDVVITPSDINYETESAYGSSKVQALIIGNTVLYVSADGRKVREIGFKWMEDSWSSKDIIFVSEHLTKDNKIVELAFAQNPNYLLACRTENDTLLMATYDKANDLVGWHRHTFTGDLLGICSLNNETTGDDVLIGIFDRDVVTSQINLEELGTNFLDCYIDIVNGSPTAAITGQTELKSQTVGVITDGAVHPDITLDASGDGTLQWTATNVTLGFNYISTSKQLPIARTVKFGNTAAMKKKWNQVYVKIVNSAYPKINGTRPPSRYPATEQGEAEPLKTEDIKATKLGWDTYGQIEIVQELPLETMVASIYGEVTEETL